MSFHPRTSPNRKQCNILHGFFCSTHSRHQTSHQFSPHLSHSLSLSISLNKPPTFCPSHVQIMTSQLHPLQTLSVSSLASTHTSTHARHATAQSAHRSTTGCVCTVAHKPKSAQPCLPTPPLDVITFNSQFRPIWYHYR